jgi:hypothetical protein
MISLPLQKCEKKVPSAVCVRCEERKSECVDWVTNKEGGKFSAEISPSGPTIVPSTPMGCQQHWYGDPMLGCPENMVESPELFLLYASMPMDEQRQEISFFYPGSDISAGSDRMIDSAIERDVDLQGEVPFDMPLSFGLGVGFFPAGQ